MKRRITTRRKGNLFNVQCRQPTWHSCYDGCLLALSKANFVELFGLNKFCIMVSSWFHRWFCCCFPQREYCFYFCSNLIVSSLFSAMVHRLDQGVGEVMQALRSKHMLENSIVLFMSDNGAPTFGIHSNRGSNHPLRGVSIFFFLISKRLQI